MDPQRGDIHAELMRLVPLVALEGRRIVEAIAERQKLHRTDVEALSRVMLADAQGASLTAGARGSESGGDLRGDHVPDEPPGTCRAR